MRKSNLVKFSDGLFTLTVRDGYEFTFTVKEEKACPRTRDQVLAIMECQHTILGELIKIVKKEAADR